MNYTSPFHLLPARDTGTLTATELKRWKKELMLQFDLHKNTTIDIQEQEYDKNDILQAFDLLKDSPEYHLRLYQNKPLLEFIENGYIDFFDDEDSWADFWDTPYRDWVAQWFVPAYDDMIYTLVENKGFESIATLRTLYKSKFNLPQEWSDIAHQKAYRYLSNFVERATGTLEAMQLIESPKVKLSNDVQEYVDVYYANVMSLLPRDFEGVRREYGDFAHDVIASIFDVERKFRDVERPTLITLREAAKIDIQIRDDDYSKGLLPLIESYLLDNRKETAKEGSNYWIWILFVVLMFSLRVCRNLNTSSTPDFATTTIIKRSDNLKKSDVFGTWKSNQAINASVQKTLTFSDESSGTMTTLLTTLHDTCEITGAFTWTLVQGNIDVYFKNIKVKKDFPEYSTVDKTLRNSILNNFSESLTPNAMKIGANSIVMSLSGENGTYIRTESLHIKKAKDPEQIKFDDESTYVMSRFKPSNTSGSFNIQRADNGDWYAHYTDEKTRIAESTMYYGKYAIVPTTWTNKAGNYTYGGYLKDIRYTDAENRTHIGDLHLYFTLVDGLKVKCKAGTQGIKNEEIVKEIEDVPPPPKAVNSNRKTSAAPLELPKMMSIPTGTFTMGCTSGDSNCNSDEKPAHKVKLEGFKMSRYEITNAQYCVFLNEKGKHNGTKPWIDIKHESVGIALNGDTYSPKPDMENLPVVKVTWYGATSYCLWLSKKTGKKYRLPTEAQWEYAARGGATHLYAGGDNVNRVACYSENTRSTCPVNSMRLPNGYGLHDMSGNVWEWCADWYKEKHYANKLLIATEKGPTSGTKRVLRGGSFTEAKMACRVSHRSWYYPTYSSNNLGFRCVRN